LVQKTIQKTSYRTTLEGCPVTLSNTVKDLGVSQTGLGCFY